MNWLIFALMTVLSWGLYGIFLHSGQTAMADKSNALFKSFLFVGLAYFLTAVLAPLAILVVRKAEWSFPPAGMGWSLLAGVGWSHRSVLCFAGLWRGWKARRGDVHRFCRRAHRQRRRGAL